MGNKRLYNIGIFLLISIIHGQQSPLELTIDFNDVRQTMRHFGSSAAFDLNELTNTWSDVNNDNLADLIFSTKLDVNERPLGLGLSSFRVEIGGCSNDQSNSGIRISNRRTDCALRPDGSYDFTRIEAETYWVDKAYEYEVAQLFGYSNSPPYYWTKNGRACNSSRSPPDLSNLEPDRYDEFAEYLAQVGLYYQNRGTALHYISPVNEPQWEWICDTQEGTQWSNENIKKLVIELDQTFRIHNLSADINIMEGGSIDRIYDFVGDITGDQLKFWVDTSSLYIGDLTKVAPYVAGHGYWTEDTDQRLVETRERMKLRIEETNPNLEWWQTEYSFLGNGFRDDGVTSDWDHGLFLAKVIHHDLALGDASAWLYWETIGSLNKSLRYKIINVNESTGTSELAETGIALQHYSFFIRPGMKRVNIVRSDNATSIQSVDGVLPTAYVNQITGDIVIVIVNYKNSDETIKINMGGPDTTGLTIYRSTSSTNFIKQPKQTTANNIILPQRSITTILATNENAIQVSIGPSQKENSFIHKIKLYRTAKGYYLSAKINELIKSKTLKVGLNSLNGKRLWINKNWDTEANPWLILPAQAKGIYFLNLKIRNQSISKYIFVP